MDSLWIALALVLILEGLLPFAAPRLWRDAFRRIGDLSDGQIRFMGFVSIIVGLVGLVLIRHA